MNNTAKLLLVFSLLISSVSLFAQRGVRVGFVDLDYILTKVPAYDTAQKNLDAKVELWKQEIAARELVIDDLKKALEVERVLLTEELIKDRELEINAATKELLQYKQQRFGPSGDLMYQQKAIMQPIQDEIFLIIKKIGEDKKFDFIFEKSDQANLLYSQKRYDLSDEVLDEFAKIDRKSNYEKSDKEINSKEAEESDINPNEAVVEREEEKNKALEKRAKEREAKKQKQLEARAKRKAEYEARKKALLEERAKKKKSSDKDKDSKADNKPKEDVKKDSTTSKKTDTKSSKLDIRAQRKAAYEARKKRLMEARKKKNKKSSKQTKDTIS